ncbi:hypothetical protein KSF_075240 [Reticulibacter mediterranei]|uniref:Calcineurin-like phosphoesterase domain-containing protein n=1 Tax=Reticulibacter mediterranei TaxID=2778369 RepID=A0A8J3IYC6_9CHLR|nr:metallophosphoesterase family protein [Reticulibacter mediterranei]GHO97476.1 hypothetical protein KSF_075240 [Reticulibacter mediterranei]
MKIALFSDIHGNPIALEAVIADIGAMGGAEEYWVLGDMVALGYDAVGAAKMIMELPKTRFVRGNTDRYVSAGDLPWKLEDVQQKPELLADFLSLARSIAWTQGVLVASGTLKWFAQLPLEQRLILPDGTRLLGVHASPGMDDGPGIHPRQSDEELRNILAGCSADLVVAGHIHVVMDRKVDNIRVVNLGSVGNPATPDLRASYAMLEADSTGYQLEIRQVEYDLEAVIAEIQRVEHPASDYLMQLASGQRLSKYRDRE